MAVSCGFPSSTIGSLVAAGYLRAELLLRLRIIGIQVRDVAQNCHILVIY
jgi:hypothetical protein